MMSDENRTTGFSGAGYILIMLIFTIICLTIFAVLSFQAAYSGNRIIGRSEEYTAQYYRADADAKKVLSKLDLLAFELSGDISFEQAFIEEAEKIEGVTAAAVPEGIITVFSSEVTQKQRLYAAVLFHKNNADERYRVVYWKTASTEDGADRHPEVWNGEEITE